MRRNWILGLFALLLGCAGTDEKGEEKRLPERKVCVAIVASPQVGGASGKGASGVDMELAFGDAISAFTLLTGGGEGYGGRQANGAVICGDLLARSGDKAALQTLVDLCGALAVPAVVVGASGATGAEAREALRSFGFGDDGSANFVKGGDAAGKAYLRLIAQRDGVAPPANAEGAWILGVRGDLVPAGAKLDARFDVIIAPSADGEIHIGAGRPLLIEVPNLNQAPARFFTLTLERQTVTLEAWPADLSQPATVPLSSQTKAF